MYMTNKDKFLKENVDPSNLIEAFIKYYYKHKEVENDVGGAFVKYMNEEIKPTLTENERVILWNIKNFTTIIRNIEGNIQVENENGSFACLCAFNHLFQFIKVRGKI